MLQVKKVCYYLALTSSIFSSFEVEIIIAINAVI